MTAPATIREYRSSRTWRGLPLVHVALGGRDIDGRYQVGRARGVVAVGGIAVGFVAVGGVAVGLVSAGGVSVGLFAAVGGAAVAAAAVGAVSLGVLAVGVVTLGVVAVGLVAVGAMTSSVTPAAGVALVGARFPRAVRRGCAGGRQGPASSARTASIVSASATVLSGRYRSTRANRRATPPG